MLRMENICFAKDNEGVIDVVEESSNIVEELSEVVEQLADLNDDWVEEDDGRHYYVDGVELLDKGYKVEGYWYYFDVSGVMVKDYWREKGGKYYYYDADGHMLVSTEAEIEGSYYHFTNTGATYQTWDKHERYYYVERGYRAQDTGVEIDGYWYYFNSRGRRLQWEWKTKNGYRYFYNKEGHLVSNCTMIIDGVQYSFDTSGKLKKFGIRMTVFSTISTNDYNGTCNMKKALLSFNQVVIQPGQTISFFDIAGPCGAAQGYLLAGVVGGMGYGGGILSGEYNLIWKFS